MFVVSKGRNPDSLKLRDTFIISEPCFSFQNPTRFPKGSNNHILVYDFRTGEWWPYCNWLADSFAIADVAGDTGQLFYGDSTDGYTHLADVTTRMDDSRNENSIETGIKYNVERKGRDHITLPFIANEKLVINLVTDAFEKKRSSHAKPQRTLRE